MSLKISRRIHFVGIGGSGMSGIAEILLNLGHKVQGSDITRSDTIYHLEKLGATVHIGHDGDNIGDAEVLVISSAVSEENPEVVAARASKIPVIPRAEMLSELMKMKDGIAVAGSHGKTTTSTMIAAILAEAEMDPTVIIGGRVKRFGSGAQLGEGEFLVAEADESDGSFLRLDPTFVVVTNVDAEHLDYYKTEERLHDAFLQFCNKVPFFGASIICGDDKVLAGFSESMNKKFITYGFNSGNNIVATDYRQDGITSVFGVTENGEPLGEVRLDMPGKHNALNALAAIQTALLLGVEFSIAVSALATFSGIGRRLELKGERNGVRVIDDYGHHPTEIMATLKGLRDAYKGRRIVTLFQPHRYTRTRDCLDGFASSFADTDELLLTPLYAASEKPIDGVDTELIYKKMVAVGTSERTLCLESNDDVQPWLEQNLRSGDILLTLGAGNIFLQGEMYLEREDGKEG